MKTQRMKMEKGTIFLINYEGYLIVFPVFSDTSKRFHEINMCQNSNFSSKLLGNIPTV